MPRGFSENEMTRIRQALIDIGMERLKITGVHKTTVEDLTSAVGISKGAFYKFYPSKEALFFNIIEICEQRLEEKFFELLPKLGSNIEVSMKNIINTVIFSREMQDYVSIMKKGDVEYLLRIVETDIATAHIGKDNTFMIAAITKLSEYGIKINTEPEKILAYISGLLCLFFEQHIFMEKYFEMVVDSYIEMLVKVVFNE